jgi:hypothetical protein
MLLLCDLTSSGSSSARQLMAASTASRQSGIGRMRRMAAWPAGVLVATSASDPNASPAALQHNKAGSRGVLTNITLH